MSRSYLSGAQKRKVAEEKRSRTSAVLEKVPKLDNYFHRNVKTPNSSGSQGLATSPELNDDPVNSTPESSNQFLVGESVHKNQGVEISNRSNDPGKWEKFTSEDVRFWIEHGPSTCQNSTGPFESSKRWYENESTSRYCSPNVFFGTKPNGEKTNRDWLIYSPMKGDV